MKRLILIRHAKSSRDNPEQDDFERPLNSRGLNDAPMMAERFLAKGILPDLIISSPALRSKATAEFFAEVLGIEKKKIHTDKHFYERGAKYISKTIREMNNSVTSLMIFAHNPDVTSLASYYTGEYFSSVPTCGMVCIEFDIDDWKKVEDENGAVVFYEFPKQILED